jgi:cysteinyl-tRNA synthetase
MEANEWLKGLQVQELNGSEADTELEKKVVRLLSELEEFINDDFNTAKALANIFELVPVINSFKDKSIALTALSNETLSLLQRKMKTYVEDILGMKSETAQEADKLKGVMSVLIELRKEARARKDWATSDKIRNQLIEMGIQLKDEKDGTISWTLM